MQHLQNEEQFTTERGAEIDRFANCIAAMHTNTRQTETVHVHSEQWAFET